MEHDVIYVYCVCEEILNTYEIEENIQCKMTTAEVAAFAIIAALFYKGNYKFTRVISKTHKYFRNILSYSRMVRRIHQIPDEVWIMIFSICKNIFKPTINKEYIVDSFPVVSCQNSKSFRCKLFPQKWYNGYCATKKMFFWGIKVHMLVNLEGVPIEFYFTPASKADIAAFRFFYLDIPKGSLIYADKAYNDYDLEDKLLEKADIKLVPKRKKNSHRKNPIDEEFSLSLHRNKIESAFSSINNFMPGYIRASTEKGFFLKIFFFILAYTIKKVLAA